MAEREALALSILVWTAQAAVAAFGVIKISENSKFGWGLVAVGVLSGLIRLASTHWEIKPTKFYPAYKQWRRASLQKAEYVTLSINDTP